jgi:K+-transporting ATPase c subunit
MSPLAAVVIFVLVLGLVYPIGNGILANVRRLRRNRDR